MDLIGSHPVISLSHGIPPQHRYIPKDPTPAQAHPTGSHHSTAPPGHGSAPRPFLSQQRHHSPLRWALGSKHGKRGKILKGRNLKKKNSLNACFRIPLPLLMTQRKMSNGSKRSSEWERGSRRPGADWLHQSRAPSIPGFVLLLEMDPRASWARWGDPKTASTSIPLERLALDPLTAPHQGRREGELIPLPSLLFQGVNFPPLECFPPLLLL